MTEKTEHAGAPENEIEITEGMIEAGLEAYALFEFDDPGRWVVSAIYRAMRVKEAQFR